MPVLGDLIGGQPGEHVTPDGALVALAEAELLLVRRAQMGDRDALEAIVRGWERRLLYYIRRLVEDEETAWDVLQETWVQVIGNIRKLRDPNSLPLWLYRIARAAAMSHWRERYTRSETQVDQERALETAEEVTFTREEADAVHWALSQLSPEHREALTLHFLEDFPVDEVAGIVGVPAGTVKSRIYYAKRLVRQMLDKDAKCHWTEPTRS